MAVSSSIAGQGVLTDSIATLRTGAGTENHVFKFYNHSSVSCFVYLYENSTTPTAQANLDANGGHYVYRCKLGTGDTLDAQAEAIDSVDWTDEMDDLA